MTDAEIETAFRKVRWPTTDGAPVCPSCGDLDAYDCRPKGGPHFRCRECGKDFSITSGTLFASHKMPLRSHLFAIAIFANEVKGKSALALARPGNILQNLLCAGAQAPQSYGRGNERPHR